MKSHLNKPKVFKKIIIAIVLAGLFVSGGAIARVKKMETGSEIAKSEPKPVPDIEYLDKESNTHRLAGLKGKVVVVNFWALWCFPCKEEMPSLDKLAKAYKNKDVVVLPLSNTTDGVSQIEAFYKKNKITNLDINFDDKNVGFKAFGLKGLPTSIILNKKGEEVARVSGYNDWNSKKTKKFIDRLSAE